MTISRYPHFQRIDPALSPSIPVDSPSPFARAMPMGRTIRAYSGVLPCTQYVARHLLKCEHLRPLPGDRFFPYQAEPHYTHQVWIWYRFHTDPSQLQLLFRGQFDFAIAGKNSAQVAAEITDYLAFLLIHSEDYQQHLFRNSGSDAFWAQAVEQYLTLEKVWSSFAISASGLTGSKAPHHLSFSASDEAFSLRWEMLSQTVHHILKSRQMGPCEQGLLITLLSKQPLTEQEERLIDQVYESIRKGLLKVVE